MDDVRVPELLFLALLGEQDPRRLEAGQGVRCGDVDVAVVPVPGNHPLLQVPGRAK